MFARLLPREGDFFALFSRHAELMVKCSREVSALMADPAEANARAHAVKTLETEADEVTRDTVRLLHKTFITPLDRDDIHQLITRMDDILDLMEDVAQLVVLYDLRVVPDEGRQLAELCLRCTEEVRSAVELLSSMKQAEKILELCHRIDQLETQADHVMRSAIARLFREEEDARQLIKLKEMVELLEAVTDRCEDVANIIEGIVLENA
jgi:predicted phosphate transport protein (TIGR00153 family)